MPSRPTSDLGLGRVLRVVHRAWNAPPRPERVHDLLEPHRVQLRPDTPATTATTRLLRAGLSGAPVYRGEQLVGFFCPRAGSLQGPVGDHLTRKVYAVRQSASLQSVVQLCDELRVAELPVVDERTRLVGRIRLDRTLDALSA